MRRLESSLGKYFHLTRREVHIDQQLSSAGQYDLALLGELCGVA